MPPAKRVKLKDLRSATAASVKAVLGKGLIKAPGVLAGLWIDADALERMNVTPSAAAQAIAKQVSATSGIRVTPSVQKADGGVLVGYLQPRVFKR